MDDREPRFGAVPDRGVVLAGGSGTRLWPLSREELPKQFLPLGEGRSLFQGTLERLGRAMPFEALRIVAHPRWRALALHQASRYGNFEEAFLEEPEARNTGPAVAWACARLILEGLPEEATLLVCPSDHAIRDEAAFLRALETGVRAAGAGFLVAFGIVPTGPETGFGYLRVRPGSGGLLGEGESPLGGGREAAPPALRAERFVEKPDRATAERFLAEGGYYWNGGIFCFRLGTLRAAMERHCPPLAELLRLADAAAAGGGSGAVPASLLRAFGSLPSISLDRAVMERAENVACVPLEAGWSDVGSFDAIYAISSKDARGNALRGEARMIDGGDNLIFAGDRLVVGADLESMIVVDTPDALFVAPRGSSQKVRDVVRALGEEGRRELAEAPESARPWGTYRVLFRSSRYKIKRIAIRPGARLSLQYHLHRTEHWVVVQGTAEVEIDGRSRLIHEGESIFVPKSAPHRLSNPGKIPLEIVEVQCGEYLGEDDIVRLEDDYRRATGSA